MRKLIAVSSMVALPSVLGLAQALPGVLTILLFSVNPGPGGWAGVFQLLGLLTLSSGININSALFSYFVSGAFPSAGNVSNLIIGL